MNRILSIFVLVIFFTVTACQTVPENVESTTVNWPQLLTGNHRDDANKARDVYRHPQQTLEFFEVQPHHHVVEIWPGGGWYTELLAPLLREQGKLYAAHFSPTSSVAFYRNSVTKFRLKMIARPDIYDQLVLTPLEPPAQTAIAAGQQVDRVLTFRNVHNWLKAGTEDAVFEAMFAALKPGGLLGVVEHRARPGTSLQQMVRSGYVTEEKVIALAKNAGFKLVEAAEINANPNDYADHPRGVWTLPPSLRLGERDKRRYLAIGESDRMTLKFVKPRDSADE